MDITSEQRQQIEQLMDAGDELAVVRYLQSTFNVSTDEAMLLAEKLKADYDRENPTPTITPQEMFERLKGGRSGLNVGKMVGTIFLSIGLIVLAVDGFLIYRDYQFQKRAVPVTGTVVDYDTHYSRDDDGGQTLMYATVYEYDFRGKHYTYTSSTSSSSPTGEVGERVEVLVDPDSPWEITVNTFWERWFIILVLTLFGGIFATVGYFVRRALGKTSRPSTP